MISIGRVGKYKGRSYLFTHRNPKNGEVWADLIPIKKQVNGRYMVVEYGMWVSSDKIEWETSHKKGA